MIMLFYVTRVAKHSLASGKSLRGGNMEGGAIDNGVTSLLGKTWK